MAHESLNQIETTVGFRSPDNTTYPDIETALRELQGLTFSVVTGVASGSAASLVGIATTDTIINVQAITAGATFVAASASVTLSGNNIQFDSNNATGLSCQVAWLDKSGA